MELEKGDLFVVVRGKEISSPQSMASFLGMEEPWQQSQSKPIYSTYLDGYLFKALASSVSNVVPCECIFPVGKLGVHRFILNFNGCEIMTVDKSWLLELTNHSTKF